MVSPTFKAYQYVKVCACEKMHAYKKAALDNQSLRCADQCGLQNLNTEGMYMYICLKVRLVWCQIQSLVTKNPDN